jgi:NAD(P)-dependent dehydrogenase (short-subunit alcohol dehydrogenase family)
MYRYARQHAVVTGAGSGIGRAVALRLAAEGATVHILDFNLESAKAVQSEIEAAGGKATAIQADLSSTASAKAAFDAVPELQVLVNSAGIAHVGSVLGTTPEDLDRLYGVNVKGVYHGLHFGLPRMLGSAHGQGGGAILNLASIASKVGISERFAYGMTKGAVLTMTLSVAKDFVAKGIRCNCVCPGRVHTPFVDGFLAETFPSDPEGKARRFEELSRYQPIGRMGTPEEIASLVAFLCSSEAAFITGSAYDIDGGVTLLR